MNLIKTSKVENIFMIRLNIISFLYILRIQLKILRVKFNWYK